MKTAPKLSLLLTNGFIIGLIVLLLNDFFLKNIFHNFLTGKLSDFAGLFIFPFFVSIFLPKPKVIYFIVGCLFTFWKLESSQFLIDRFIDSTNLGIHRIVDATDLFALLILPISYHYFKHKSTVLYQNKFIFSIFISIISLFSFCSTTLPTRKFKINIQSKKTFVLPINKTKLFKQLESRFMYSDNLTKNLKDSLFYLFFDIPKYSADGTALVKIKSIETNKTKIEIERFTEYEITGKLFSGIKQSDIESCKKLTSTDFEKFLKSNYINVLLKKKEKDHELYFDNKESSNY